MDIETAQLLCQINNEFYAQVSDSFSATRKAPWNGWRRCVDILRDNEVAHIVDIACGNMRFESFVLDEYTHSDVSLTIDAIDDCVGLLPDDIRDAVEFHELDVVDVLIHDARRIAQEMDHVACDAVVSFGFMHHIPGKINRIAFICDMLDMVRPGGFVVVSLWQFMNHEGLASKARYTHENALCDLAERGLDEQCLEEGDYFLGWKDEKSLYRYCHHFSSLEIAEMIESVESRATVYDQFEADGRTDNLNTYLIFRKR